MHDASHRVSFAHIDSPLVTRSVRLVVIYQSSAFFLLYLKYLRFVFLPRLKTHHVSFYAAIGPRPEAMGASCLLFSRLDCTSCARPRPRTRLFRDNDRAHIEIYAKIMPHGHARRYLHQARPVHARVLGACFPLPYQDRVLSPFSPYVF